MEELEALQLAANNAVGALNAWGDLVVSHLQDIPTHVGEITLQGYNTPVVCLAFVHLHYIT